MKLFGKYTFHWWQLGILKLSIITLGLIIGASWSQTVQQVMYPLGVLFVISSVYIIVVSLKQ